MIKGNKHQIPYVNHAQPQTPHTHTHTHTHHTHTHTNTHTHTHTHLALLENPVNPEDMVQYLIEQHKWNVQLLLVEHLESCLNVVSQLFLVYWEIVL